MSRERELDALRFCNVCGEDKPLLRLGKSWDEWAGARLCENCWRRLAVSPESFRDQRIIAAQRLARVVKQAHTSLHVIALTECDGSCPSLHALKEWEEAQAYE